MTEDELPVPNRIAGDVGMPLPPYWHGFPYGEGSSRTGAKRESVARDCSNRESRQCPPEREAGKIAYCNYFF